MADTRKDKRAPVSLKVRFKSATVDEFIEHYSKDVSRGGIYIKSSQPMSVGTLLKFQFQLKDESALIRGVGRVVWTRIEEDATADSPAGMGIKFIKMDNESRAMVDRIVDGHEPEHGGTYESGRFNATSAEPTSSAPPAPGAEPFFPDLPPAELPPPEDRTAVRQATEFLAAALTEGGTDESATREAQEKAEEARKRTEEVEAERREAAEAKRQEELEARNTLRPQQQPDAKDEAPEQGSLPSMIIDPSLEPRAGRASEQAPGSDVTPLPRPNVAILDASRSPEAPSAAGTDNEPDTEPPPPIVAPAPATEMPSAPLSMPTLSELPVKKSSLLPYLVIAAVLAVAAFVFFRGSPSESSEDTLADEKPGSHDETVREIEAQPAPVVAPEPAAEATPEPAVEPSADAQVAELAPTPAATAELVALEVSTKPTGAEIYIGEEKQGPAPVSLKLPVGSAVVVRAVAPGFKEASQELTPLKKGKLGLKLEPLPYTVRVESTPPGAAINVGAYKGVAPVELTFDKPPMGQLAVNAKLDGFEPTKAQLKLDAFSESDGAMRAQLAITLQPSLPKAEGKEAVPATPKEKPKKIPTAKKVPEPAVEGAPQAAPVEKAPEPAAAEPEAKPEPQPEAKPETLPDNPFGE